MLASAAGAWPPSSRSSRTTSWQARSGRERSLLHRAGLRRQDLLPDQLGDKVRDLAPSPRRPACHGLEQPPQRVLLRQGIPRQMPQRRADAYACASPRTLEGWVSAFFSLARRGTDARLALTGRRARGHRSSPVEGMSFAGPEAACGIEGCPWWHGSSSQTQAEPRRYFNVELLPSSSSGGHRRFPISCSASKTRRPGSWWRTTRSCRFG